MEERLLDLFGKVFQWRVNIYLIMLAQRIEHLRKIYGMTVCPWNNGAFPQGEILVRNDKIWVKIPLCAKATTFRACTLRIVKRKHLWC